MAIMRLRQWAFERSALRHGRTTKLKRDGWRERRSCESDSRQVRVIDFERALSSLTEIDQQMLVLAYRDSVPRVQAARILGMSPRKYYYDLPLARGRLANILDRLDLL
jgi:DNA-directed RNA polymerase specialized sigma24 family protein